MGTFEQAWRQVLLYAPAVPVFLARQFVQSAYNTLSADRPWAHLRKETHLQTLASRTLTVTFTAASTAITSTAAFVATDVGRQLSVTGALVYTIASVESASAATLLESYKGDSGAATARIFSGYLVCPEDFGRFESIVDPSTQRVIPFWHTREVLDWIDPHRTSSGDPSRVLVPRGISAVPAYAGRVLYEWWPQPTAARSYPALYIAAPAPLTDTTPFTGVLANRWEVLVTGALAECAAWPGTAEKPNPYFNLNTHRLKREQFERETLQLALRDDDTVAMDLPQLPWHQYQGWSLAFDTNLLRSSDADISSYY
jgi:hypothetical protein